jgi:hypothetical protein
VERGKVRDHVRANSLDDSRDGASVANVGLMDDSSAREPLAPSAREVVEHVNVFGLAQILDEVTTDESGPAGNEDAPVSARRAQGRISS